ncbi:PIG-L family deacetylase [Sphingobacterium sp. MYb382]|uniref:PIG-L family deacetylase n=1 Tax=Sphingobacterium sp. MYb382 TaxID=2745278 RepID=UPI0030AFBF83
MKKRYLSLCFLGLLIGKAFAQSYTPIHAADIQLQMEKLNTLGSVLYFAAHPDDENTKLIAYLASERKVRTAYLSLTRGDGGQNLIGTEQGEELGLIRTQELLQARKIDRGEQYFTAAYDFGFSKTYDETFRFWNKQEVLREAVFIIRKLQPDVIITRFPPDERGGHGHHQASALLAREAFDAAADPKAFPEQLSEVQPWQAKRLIWNTANFMSMQGNSTNQLKVDIGQYNTLLGESYGELSARSRSQHKSQGFGSAASNGSSIESFEHVAGSQAQLDIFDQVDLSWKRVKGGAPVSLAIEKLVQNYNAVKPQASIPALVQLWHLVQKVESPYWKEKKTKEIERLILACAGLHIEAIAPKPYAAVGTNSPFQARLVVRNAGVNLSLVSLNGQNIQQKLADNSLTVFNGELPLATETQPYWLAKPHSLGKFDVPAQNFGYPTNPDLPAVATLLGIGDLTIKLNLPLQYKYVDPVRGEVYEYVQVRPQITAQAEQKVLLVNKGESKTLQVSFQAQQENLGTVAVQLSLAGSGWKISPEIVNLAFDQQGNSTQTITISNVNADENTTKLDFLVQGKPLTTLREIAYAHIPTQAWFPPATVSLKNIDLINPVKTVAYIMGAGDRVPEALRELGIQVDILKTADITASLLAKYDALVFGVRVLNVDKQIGQKLPLIYKYVENGGVALMQYNVNNPLQKENFAPKPFQLSRARVTEEDAKVTFTDPKDPVLNYPNKITEKDFSNWIQERGLYFAENVDPSYRKPLVMHDQKEGPHQGSLLIQKIGKGKFVYTSLSFFRQLPAGIPGANRLFVNLLAKEQ